LSTRVSAVLDDVEGPQANDADGATDLDLGGTIVALRFTSLAIPPGAVITAASIQFTADQAFSADNTTAINLDVFAEAATTHRLLRATWSTISASCRARASRSAGSSHPGWCRIPGRLSALRT
jgi:hypothetical protein